MEVSVLETLLISALQPLLGSAVRALIGFTGIGEKKVTARIVSRLKKEIGSWRHRIPFAGSVAKIAVVVVFTVCWLLIALVRSHEGSDAAASEGSSLLGLATALQQGAISGRDFQSMYGPAAQLLAWIATAATVTRSALDAYGMITFFFCAASALLAAAMLLICDRISWQECAIFYAFSLFLNLFFHAFDIRAALLLLNAIVAYRIIAAETLRRQIVWATGSGLLCFVAQLVTFELGICAAIAVVCALAVGSILTRRAVVLLAVEVFVATLVVANLGLAIVFKLTSSSYKLLFDYHNYSLEILHGYHNSMGILWGLSPERTLVLAIVALYVIGVCAAAAWRTDPLDASLLASLAFAALIWFKTALIRSDIPQIVLAFTPVIVILSLLARREWISPARRGVWAAAACGALLVWPSSNLTAPADLGKVIRGDTNARAAIRDIYKTARPLDTSLRASLISPDLANRRDVSILAFPYDNYISAGRGSFFAPVLESYGASTESLERYYIRALDSRRRAGLEIVYGIDGGAVEQLKFSIPQQSEDSGILKLDAPSACGLVLLDIRIDYAKNPHVFRPSGVELSLSNSDRPVWRGSIRPLALNESFVTYVSPLPSETFHKVFGQDPVQGVKWDKIEYHASSTDMLGSRPGLIRVGAVQCVDPKRFGEAAVSEPNSSPGGIVTDTPADIDGLD